MPRFDPSHPSTLAIYCSDGRYTHSIEAAPDGDTVAFADITPRVKSE